MNKQKSTSVMSTPLVLYFVLAYAFSWAIGIPLALSEKGIIQPILPEWAHYFIAFGPALSAIIVTGTFEGRDGLRRLISRVTCWHVSMRWWAVALLPLLVGLGTILGLRVISGSWVDWLSFGEVHFLPSLGFGALFLWILTFGIGEETGWRGFALPRLQQSRSAFAATSILAILWALWHLPQFFYLFDPAIAIGWALGLYGGAIVFTWLFNSTGGSVLILAVCHGAINFMTGSNAGDGLIAAVVSTAVMVWAVLVVLIFKPVNLSRNTKITAQVLPNEAMRVEPQAVVKHADAGSGS
jgi:membrane protease YdiL (CAAX protease family)